MASDESEKTRLPPIGFWSYARADEELVKGRLGLILKQIKVELSSRFVDLKIFQDAESIRHGEEWEVRINDEIARSTFFIPILTPHFLQSKWCLHEVERFIDRERALLEAHPDLPQTSRIFPIHYVDIEDAPSSRPDLAEVLSRRQWFDMREIRYEERVDVGAAGRSIGNYAKSIRDLLMIQVSTPLTPEQIAERQAEAAQREAEDIARRAREAATRAAVRSQLEEERLRFERALAVRREQEQRQRKFIRWLARIIPGASFRLGPQPVSKRTHALILAAGVGLLIAALILAFVEIPTARAPVAMATPVSPPKPPAALTPEPPPVTEIQFGAFPTEAAARAAWGRIAAKNAAIKPLRWYTEQAQVNGRTVYRLKAQAVSMEQGQLLCSAIIISGEPCVTISPRPPSATPQ